MDIKDWILIGGGVLLAAVVGHGFWLAWKSRRAPYRLEIDPNIPKDEVDDMVLLRGELPNGGARVRPAGGPAPEQASLELAEAEPAKPPPTTDLGLTTERRGPVRPSGTTRKSILDRPKPRVPSKSPPFTSHSLSGHHAQQMSLSAEPPASKQPTASKQPVREPSEIIAINVLARGDSRMNGSDLMEVFLRNSLKFGDMNVFHRIDPTSKEVQFSVASAVEPGTFDLSAMQHFSTPGVTLFLRLPGPGKPADVFDDMLGVARDLAQSLNAELKDEQHSVMTAQTVAHCRQRISEFARKRMSQRS